MKKKRSRFHAVEMLLQSNGEKLATENPIVDFYRLSLDAHLCDIVLQAMSLFNWLCFRIKALISGLI